LLGVLPTKISTNPKFVSVTLPRRRQLVAERYGVPLMDATIFEREDLAKCTEQVERLGDQEIPAPISVQDFKPDSTATQEFEKLADEVMAGAGLLRAEVTR
jgi:hypothetical protein